MTDKLISPLSPCVLCGVRPELYEYHDYPSERNGIELPEHGGHVLIWIQEHYHHCDVWGDDYIGYARLYDTPPTSTWSERNAEALSHRYAPAILRRQLAIHLCKLIGHKLDSGVTDSGWFICRRCGAHEYQDQDKYDDSYFYAPYLWIESIRLAIEKEKDRLTLWHYEWQHRNDDDSSIPF